MAGLTTHVLDTANGCPAQGVRVELWLITPDGREKICERNTNADGRTDEPMLFAAETREGIYELVFHLGAYFAGKGAAAQGQPFLDVVPVRFAITELERHYHVPLLAAPWSYTTYRGS